MFFFQTEVAKLCQQFDITVQNTGRVNTAVCSTYNTGLVPVLTATELSVGL
jgi:hypothetical protein